VTSTSVLFDARDDGIAVITINRPETRNCLSADVRAGLAAAWDRFERDPALRVAILTGAGEKAFCAGGDLKEMVETGMKVPPRDMFALPYDTVELSKPTIAAVNGAAVGLGCDLALCCDFIIASDAAVFAMSFIERGLVPDGGGLYLLPRRVGLVRAKELIFTGRRVKPDEALHIGLIDRLTSADKLLGEARAWAIELSRGSPTALALAKSILDRSFELSEEEALALGREAQAICYTTKEHQDSVAAFLRKKAP
jgi:enoyl-CoA hydratase/carnithine racemase